MTATDAPAHGERSYPLDPQGRALIPAGGHVVTFAFSDPEAAYIPSQATAALGVYKAPTTLTLQSNHPDATPGEEVTFTATVAYASSTSRPATGFVEFYEGTRLAATIPVGPDGRASVSTSGLLPGTYTLTAVYLESQDLQGSVSAPLVQQATVPPRPATTTATALASTVNPAVAGQDLAFIVQVNGPPGGLWPTSGLVRFYLGLEAIAERPVDSNGRATLEARFDAAGDYVITAVYLGSDRFDTSQSGHLTQAVSAEPVSAPLAAAKAVPSAATQGVSLAGSTATGRRAARTPLLAKLAQRRPHAMRFRG